MLKPDWMYCGVNFLGSGEFIKIPRIEWAVGMGHKRINAGLTPVDVIEWKNLFLLFKLKI